MPEGPAWAWRLMNRRFSFVDNNGRIAQDAGSGMLHPTAPGGSLSKEVSKIRQKRNPHDHSLAEAIKVVHQNNPPRSRSA